MALQTDNWYRRLAEHDIQAFEVLYARCYLLLKKAGAKFVTAEEAEDCVSEIFLKLWLNPPVFESEAALFKYLYNALYHSCLNKLRHQKQKDRYAAYRQSLAPEVVELALIEERVYQHLMQEVETLPDHYKQTIELSLDGVGLQEIARQLHTSYESVKGWKKRAKLLLKQRLKQISVFF